MDADLNLSIIAAVARNGVIGRGNDIPWKLRRDLKRFRLLTDSHLVIAGRKTHESIVARLGRPLPGRDTIVLTRDPTYRAEHCAVTTDWSIVLETIRTSGRDAFVIGGAEIYALALPFASTFYLTTVEADPPGDAFFPTWNRQAWYHVACERIPQDKENEFPCTFETWRRKPV